MIETVRRVADYDICHRITLRRAEISMPRKLLNLSAAMLVFTTGAGAAPANISIALKGGESAEIANLFWALNCRSQLNGPMTAEVLDGPADVTTSIKDQKIVPHIQNCAKPVSGGILLLTAAKTIKARTQAKVLVRVKYPTVDGERQKAFDIDVILLP